MNYFDSQALMGKSVSKDTIKTADFFKYDEVPMQRNHEVRAAYVAKELLKNPFILSGLEVALVEYPDGKREIANGNTRKFIWMNYDDFGVPVPSHLYATIYKVNDLEDVKRLYYSFDSQLAVENSRHKITGHYRQLGLNFSDRTLASGGTSKAFEYIGNGYITSNGQQLNGKRNVYDVITEFREELLALDKIKIGQHLRGQAIIASTLMVMKKYGTHNPRVKELIKNLKVGAGSYNGNSGDGVYWIVNKLSSKEYCGDSWNKTDGVSMPKCLSHILYCMDKFIDDESISKIGGSVHTYYENFWNN